jgi:peptide/nickel transport system substrate-binding protein
VIRAAGGNTNLGIRIPAVDAAIDKALATTDVKAREAIWGDIDQMVMENAAVVPGVWNKGLFYRPDNLTNVFVNDGFGQYDYTVMGTPGSSDRAGSTNALDHALEQHTEQHTRTTQR